MRAARAARSNRQLGNSSSLPSLSGRSSPEISERRFRIGYHQTSWENGQSILRNGFQNKDRIQGATAMLGPGVYFALTPQDTCGKAQHGQALAMMLECYINVGEMDILHSKNDFRNATDADSVYWRGFAGRPEFVVKDNHKICVVWAYQCDPQTGNPIGNMDLALRDQRLQYAQTVWRKQQMAEDRKFEVQLDRFEAALEHYEEKGRGKLAPKDRKRLTAVFNKFAGSKGWLNHAELYALLCAVDMCPDNNKSDLAETFKDFDDNGNGKVGLNEFLREMKHRAKYGEYRY